MTTLSKFLLTNKIVKAMNTRLAPFALSVILPLFLFSWFVPTGVLQLDLLLLWGIAMLFVGLPMVLLELALAKRSQKSVWQGMQVLTREADAKLQWRSFSYLSVLTSFVLSAGFVVGSAERLLDLPKLAQIPSYAISFGLMVGVLIVSLLKGRLLVLSAVAFLVSAVLSLALGKVGTVAMTAMGLKEWTLAVTMALGSVGVGTGLYWFLAGQTQKSITAQALPIWGCQLVFGALAIVVHSFGFGELARLVGVIGAVLVAGFFAYYGASQLIARFGLMMGVAMTVVALLLLSAVPSGVFGWVFGVVALLSAFVLALFAGFAMKISHLRKTLQFKGELQYNLWRVAVRWLVPLAIVSAWAGLAMLGFGQ